MYFIHEDTGESRWTFPVRPLGTGKGKRERGGGGREGRGTEEGCLTYLFLEFFLWFQIRGIGEGKRERAKGSERWGREEGSLLPNLKRCLSL